MIKVSAGISRSTITIWGHQKQQKMANFWIFSDFSQKDGFRVTSYLAVLGFLSRHVTPQRIRQDPTNNPSEGPKPSHPLFSGARGKLPNIQEQLGVFGENEVFGWGFRVGFSGRKPPLFGPKTPLFGPKTPFRAGNPPFSGGFRPIWGFRPILEVDHRKVKTRQKTHQRLPFGPKTSI